jgi:hypothetical protein
MLRSTFKNHIIDLLHLTLLFIIHTGQCGRAEAKTFIFIVPCTNYIHTPISEKLGMEVPYTNLCFRLVNL